LKNNKEQGKSFAFISSAPNYFFNSSSAPLSAAQREEQGEGRVSTPASTFAWSDFAGMMMEVCRQ